MENSDWSVQTLKQHFEALKFEQDKALTLALRQLEYRLEILNGAHAEARRKENDFYGKAEHLVYAATTMDEIARLSEAIDRVSRPNWAVLLSLVTIMIAVTAGLWSLAFEPIKAQVAENTVGIRQGILPIAAERMQTMQSQLNALLLQIESLKREHIEWIRTHDAKEDVDRKP